MKIILESNTATPKQVEEAISAISDVWSKYKNVELLIHVEEEFENLSEAQMIELFLKSKYFKSSAIVRDGNFKVIK